MIPVMLLINCSSVENKWKCGAQFHQVCFQYPVDYPYPEDKMALVNPGYFFFSFTVPEKPAWGINSSTQMEILHSYLKEFSPKPSTNMVSVILCCNVSCPFVQLKRLCWTQTDITANLPKDVGWLKKLSCFVLKLTNVYDNTNELSSVQKCAFQITQRQFFCILIILNFISLIFSWS